MLIPNLVWYRFLGTVNKSNPQPILLSDIIKNFFNDQQFLQSDQCFGIKLWKIWPQLTEGTILKEAKPVSYQNGHLVLWVANSVQLQETHFHIDELKNKINQHFEKKYVEEIHFTFNKSILEKRQKTIELLGW